MLLYLNKETFAGPGGEALAKEVGAALDVGTPPLLVHETDPEKGAVEVRGHCLTAAKTQPAPYAEPRLPSPAPDVRVSPPLHSFATLLALRGRYLSTNRPFCRRACTTASPRR